MKKRCLLLALLFACVLTGCKKETIEPAVTERVEKPKVTNAVAETTVTREYNDVETTTVDYGIVTKPVETEYVPSTTISYPEDDEPLVVTFSEPKTSFTQQAVMNILNDTSWAKGIDKMRVAFCDVNLDGVPEMLVTDMNKMTTYESYDVFETQIIDLRTMECRSIIQDMAVSALTCFTSDTVGTHWGFCIEEGGFIFNEDCSTRQVYAFQGDDVSEHYYVDGSEITYDEYLAIVDEYFNYGAADTDNTLVACQRYITVENKSFFSDYIEDALAQWCVENHEPEAASIQ